MKMEFNVDTPGATGAPREIVDIIWSNTEGFYLNVSVNKDEFREIYHQMRKAFTREYGELP